MKKILLLLLIISSFFFYHFVKADSLQSRLSGRILLQVEDEGEAWYVDPGTQKRYFLGRPDDAFDVMKNFGIGISNQDWNNIYTSKDKETLENLSGQIILLVEQNGEAYYINPVDLKYYLLGRPSDAFNIMTELGLGISNKMLQQIEIGDITKDNFILAEMNEKIEENEIVENTNFNLINDSKAYLTLGNVGLTGSRPGGRLQYPTESIWEIDFNTREITDMLLIDNILLVCNYLGDVLAINTENGKVIWEHKYDRGIKYDSLLVEENVLYLMTDNLYAINVLSGDILWEFNDYLGINGIPTILGDEIVISASTDRVIGINKVNGNLVFEFNEFDLEDYYTWDRITIGGNLFFINVVENIEQSRNYHVFGIDRKNLKVVFHEEYFQNEISHPVVANDKLYITQKDYGLFIYDLKSFSLDESFELANEATTVTNIAPVISENEDILMVGRNYGDLELVYKKNNRSFFLWGFHRNFYIDSTELTNVVNIKTIDNVMYVNSYEYLVAYDLLIEQVLWQMPVKPVRFEIGDNQIFFAHDDKIIAASGL